MGKKDLATKNGSERGKEFVKEIAKWRSTSDYNIKYLRSLIKELEGYLFHLECGD